MERDREPKKKAICYIDGFNLYYGALKGTKYKWLNLLKLSEQLLQNYDLVQVNYYTAEIIPTPQDPRSLMRQQIYWRALRSTNKVNIVKGMFKERHRPCYLVNPIPGIPQRQVVKVREEKGSDVNLAVHLVRDACLKTIDCACIISNDSDLAEAVRIATNDLGLTSIICNPHIGQYTSIELKMWQRKHAH